MSKAKWLPFALCFLFPLLLTGCSSPAGSTLETPPSSSRLSQERLDTLASIQKLTDYADWNVYSMDVKYPYDLDKLTPVGLQDTQEYMNLIFDAALPGIDLGYTAPDYGCSAFSLANAEGGYFMGRNYDFKLDSSAMIVSCHPEDGYASVGHAALDNIHANDPFASDSAKLACLTAPFICIDGINEKGVGIAVLTLDSDPVCQNTGKPVLGTTMLIRLVLDRAASTSEAVELLRNYDMLAICGRDYHFFITDNTGNSVVVEFDCESPERAMVVTPSSIATNFYIKYKDNVLPNQKNGIYGHGRERYDAIEAIFDRENWVGGSDTAWEALKAAAQLPNPEVVTSNTQWSISYNLSDLSYELVLHRNWEDVLHIDTLSQSKQAE